MNCLKNPRYKYRRQVEYASRAMELNMVHLGTILNTVHTFFTKEFSKKKCREFVEEYINMVDQYDDAEEREYMINHELKRSPWLTRDTVHALFLHFAENAKTPLDKDIYANKGIAPLLEMNVLMMLIQLRVDYQWGRARMARLIDLMLYADCPEPIKWLEGINVVMSPNDDSAYELVQKMRKRDKPTATLREQLDARRELEALKRYQEGKI